MSFNEDSFICDNDRFEKLRIGRLRTDRETIQAKTYKNWINSVLIKARTSIDDIYTDLADGQKLLLLLELITGEKIAEPNRGSSVLHRIENVSRCLKFIRSKDVYLESIGPEDIVNCNKRLVLGLIWTIILRFQLSQHLDFVKYDLKTIKDSMLLWCQSKTSKSSRCKVRDFKRSWSDGWAFVELVRSFRPDLIDTVSLSNLNNVQMLDKAFEVANQHLMIPHILDAEDVATSADENSILTYISYFYNLYCRNKTTGTGSKRIKNIITQISEVQSAQNSYEAQVSELMKWIKERTVHFERPIDINNAHEQMSQFNNYFFAERPEKLSSRNTAESLYLDIVNLHKKMGLRSFVPKSNLTVKDLEKAWMHLEDVETRRQSQLKEKIVKFEQLTKIMDTFDLKCLKLENYIAEKLALLNQIYQWKSTNSDDYSHTELSSLEVYLKQSELICCDIVSNSAKFDSIFKLTDQLVEHRYKNYEFAEMCCRHLKAKLKNLTEMAARNHRTIEATTKTITYLKQLDCLKSELEQLKVSLVALPQNRTNSVQNVFSNLEKCKQYETELGLLERQFLVVQSRLFLLTDNNNHQSSVLIDSSILQRRLNAFRIPLDQCRQLLEHHITLNHQNLDYNEFREEIEYLQMFFNEKTILCQSSLDTCYDSTNIFSLQQRHNIIKLEVKTVQQQFFDACEKGYRLMSKENYYSPLVNESIDPTKQSLSHLMTLVNERTFLIHDSIQLLRLVEQLGEINLLKLEDLQQTVYSCIEEADEMRRLELVELGELLEKMNALKVSAEHMEHQDQWAMSSSNTWSVHLVHLKEYSQSAVVVDHRHAFLVLRLEQPVHRLHDTHTHCRLLRLVTDSFHAAKQLITATAVDVNESTLRRLLLERHQANCYEHDDEHIRLSQVPSTSGHNLQETEQMVDLFLSADNRLEHFIDSLQERQAMVQSDMASMNELMAFVRHTLQLLKVTQTFTRTFVQVKADQRHREYFHKLRQSQTKSSIVPADDSVNDKTTSTSKLPVHASTISDYQSKLNPEAFKFKVVTYKLQQNLKFIGNYLGTVNDDSAAALEFKLDFSSDLIRKDIAQLSQLLKEKSENLANLELRQEAEKTAALIDNVIQNEAQMNGKVATLQHLEAVEDFFQTMADNVKQIEQVRTDADQVTMRKHVRQMKTMSVTLQSHFEELISGAETFKSRTVDFNDVKMYKNRISSLKNRFTQFQQLISQKSELCRQRLEPDNVQISQMTAIKQHNIKIFNSSSASDQLDSVTAQEPNQVLEERKSETEQTLKDDLKRQLNNAEMVLFEIESTGNVCESKFAEAMAICDNALSNPLAANDHTLQQRIVTLKTQLTRAWNSQMKQNELKQFNLLSSEFMIKCNQGIQNVTAMQYGGQEIAKCKQKAIQLQLDQRAIYEQYHLSESGEIVSRLVQLQDLLAKYEKMITKKEKVAETCAQLDDITKRFKLINNCISLENLLNEIDAVIKVSNKTSLSDEHRHLLTQKSMTLKKNIIEEQIKVKLNAVVKQMANLTDQNQVNNCLVLKNTCKNLLKTSEQLSIDTYNNNNKIDELLLNWSLIKDKVDRISDLIENTCYQSNITKNTVSTASDNFNQMENQPICQPISTSTLPSVTEVSFPNQSEQLFSQFKSTIENIQPVSSNDDHLQTSEAILPDTDLTTEFDSKTNDRIGTRASLESDFSADYLLSIKDFGSMQASSDENFVSHNFTESTLSLYYSESDSGHCELNYNINSPESRGDHQAGVCTECQQSAADIDLNQRHLTTEMGTSRQTISSSFTSLPMNVTEYVESSDELETEAENEQSKECQQMSDHAAELSIQQLEIDFQNAEQMCTEMWTRAKFAFEQINNMVINRKYSANQQTHKLLNDLSFAFANHQQFAQNEEGWLSNANENTQNICNRVKHLLNTLSQSNSQINYLVDHELQYLSNLSDKIENTEPIDDEFLVNELDNHADNKEAPLAEQEDSWMPDEEVDLPQNYVLSKSHHIDFTLTDLSILQRGESGLSFTSDIAGDNLHIGESVQPQLEGLEEKVDGIKSELEDIAARIAKHSDGKRLSFEVGDLNEMFEFKVPDSVLQTKKTCDSIDGNKLAISSTCADNEIDQNDESNNEITNQIEKELKNSDSQNVFHLDSNEIQKPDYLYENDSLNNGSSSSSSGGKQQRQQEEDFAAGDEKMSSVVDFDELPEEKNDNNNYEHSDSEQPIFDEKQTAETETEKLALKNNKIKADFQTKFSNDENSLHTSNSVASNLLFFTVANQLSTKDNKIEAVNETKLDCLEEQVHQIANQLDLIAEKLFEHVQNESIKANVENSNVSGQQSLQESTAIFKTDTTPKIQQINSTTTTTSNVEVHQSSDCQSNSAVLQLVQSNPELAKIKNTFDDSLTNMHKCTPSETFLSDHSRPINDNTCSIQPSSMTVESFEHESKENEQEAQTSVQNVISLPTENTSNSLHDVQNVNFISNKINLPFDENSSLHSTNLDKINNESIIDENINVIEIKSDETVNCTGKSLDCSLLTTEKLGENTTLNKVNRKEFSRQSDSAQEKVIKDNIHLSSTESAIYLHKSSNQQPFDEPVVMFTQNSKNSTVSSILSTISSTDVSVQTMSVQQTNEDKINIWSSDEKVEESFNGSESLDTLTQNVTADERNTIVHVCQNKLRQSTDHVDQLIENHNVNSVVQKKKKKKKKKKKNSLVQNRQTEYLSYSELETGTNDDELKNDNFTEGEKSAHDDLHLSDNVEKTENFNNRPNCLEKTTDKIASQFDATAVQLVNLAKRDSFENLKSTDDISLVLDKLPQSRETQTSANISLAVTVPFHNDLENTNDNRSSSTANNSIVKDMSNKENDEFENCTIKTFTESVGKCENEMLENELHGLQESLPCDHLKSSAHFSICKTEKENPSKLELENALQTSDLSVEIANLNYENDSFEKATKEIVSTSQNEQHQNIIELSVVAQTKIDQTLSFSSSSCSLQSETDSENLNNFSSPCNLEIATLNNQQNVQTESEILSSLENSVTKIELQIHYLLTKVINIYNQNQQNEINSNNNNKLIHREDESALLPLPVEGNHNFDLPTNESQNLRSPENENKFETKYQHFEAENTFETNLISPVLSDTKHNYSLSKSHHINFKSLSSNLNEDDQLNKNVDTYLQQHNYSITPNNETISHFLKDNQINGRCSFPNPQKSFESNASQVLSMPKSEIELGFVDTKSTDVAHSQNLTENIEPAQQQFSDCNIDSVHQKDSPVILTEEKIESATVFHTNNLPNMSSFENTATDLSQVSLTEKDLTTSFDETQLDSLENRIQLIASKLDDIAESLMEKVETQKLFEEKSRDLYAFTEKNVSTKLVLTNLKHDQQEMLPKFNLTNSTDDAETQQNLLVPDFHSNSSNMSELSKVEDGHNSMQPETQADASSTTKSGDTVADNATQMSFTNEFLSSGNTEQTEMCIQCNHDESSMQDILKMSNNKQLKSDLIDNSSTKEEDVFTCDHSVLNDSTVASQQVADPEREILSNCAQQVSDERNNLAISKTNTSRSSQITCPTLLTEILSETHLNTTKLAQSETCKPENLSTDEGVNETNMDDKSTQSADVSDSNTEKSIPERCHSNNSMTYADAVKLSSVDCQVKSGDSSNPSIQISPNLPFSVSSTSSDYSESSSRDMNKVICDDDALLDYIETRVNVLDSEISNLTDWFREYCTASRRPENMEHLIWPKLEVLAIEHDNKFFEQMESNQSIASGASYFTENDDTSIELASDESIDESNVPFDNLSIPTDHQNMENPFQQNNVYSADLKKEPPIIYSVHDITVKESAESDPINSKNVNLITKTNVPTESNEQQSSTSIVKPNELQSNTFQPKCLPENADELEHSIISKNQLLKVQVLSEIDSSQVAFIETINKVHDQKVQSCELSSLARPSSQLHDTHVFDTSSSTSTVQKTTFISPETDSSDNRADGEIEKSASAVSDDNQSDDARKELICPTTDQDFNKSLDREPRSISEPDQTVSVTVLQTDILPNMTLSEDTAVECLESTDFVDHPSSNTYNDAVKKNLFEEKKLIDLTSDMPLVEDGLSTSYSESDLKDVFANQQEGFEDASQFSAKPNQNDEEEQVSTLQSLDSKQHLLSISAGHCSTVAAVCDSNENVFESASADLSDNKNAENGTSTLDIENRDQSSVETFPSSSVDVNLLGKDLADNNVPQEDNDLIADKWQLNDTEDGNGKGEQTLEDHKESMRAIDTVAILSTSPANDRMDYAVVSTQSDIPVSESMQLQVFNSSSKQVMTLETFESRPSSEEQQNGPPFGSFLSRNLGRVARYSLPCYLLPFLLLLILLVFPSTESDFNCLLQFDEYRSGIIKTYQDGPPPM